MNDDDTGGKWEIPGMTWTMPIAEAVTSMPSAMVPVVSPVERLARYRPAMVPHSPVLAAQMVADPDGEWVRRADVLALLG